MCAHSAVQSNADKCSAGQPTQGEVPMFDCFGSGLLLGLESWQDIELAGSEVGLFRDI